MGYFRFIEYINNSGLVAEVENKTGTAQKVVSTHFLSCLSTPKQLQINELPIEIIDKDSSNLSISKALPWCSLEAPINTASPSKYLVALVGVQSYLCL